MLGFAGSEHPRLISHEIILVVQPMSPGYLNITDRQSNCHSNTVLYLASCGVKKNVFNWHLKQSKSNGWIRQIVQQRITESGAHNWNGPTTIDAHMVTWDDKNVMIGGIERWFSQ